VDGKLGDMRVSSLHVYPVKSLHRVDVAAAAVEPWGLAGDRRWLVVEPDTGKFLTQRELPGMVLIRPEPTSGGLILRTPGRADLDVAAPVGGDRVEVSVWRSRVKAARAGAAADAWLSAALGNDVALVYLDDPTQRTLGPGYGEPGDRVNFADGYPALLANEASLDALNGWLAEPLPMTRFRPNVVVSGFPAWAEDGWIGRRVRLGTMTFRVPKACGRCVITTTDQETGERGREPLHTLATFRREGDGLMFAVNLIPDGIGSLAVGDPVEAL
jgi:uncharacterized protein YcbX